MSKIEIRKAILGNRIRMFLLSYARRLALPLNAAYFYSLLLLFFFYYSRCHYARVQYF